jgi:hypothetical protein
MRLGAVARCCHLTGCPTSDILLARNGFQMGWIYAEPVVAAVVDDKPCRDRSMDQLVGIPMGV